MNDAWLKKAQVVLLGGEDQGVLVARARVTDAGAFLYPRDEAGTPGTFIPWWRVVHIAEIPEPVAAAPRVPTVMQTKQAVQGMTSGVDVKLDMGGQ